MRSAFIRYFCPLSNLIFSFQFSLHFGKNFLVGSERTPGSYHLFFFLPTQSNTLQKKISSHFLSKVFQLPYFTSKQTHPKRGSWQNFTNGDLKDVLLCLLLIQVLLISVTFLKIIKLDKIIQKIFILND